MKIHRMFRLFLTLAVLASGSAIAQPSAYASDEGSGTISVIDTATDHVQATITTGG